MSFEPGKWKKWIFNKKTKEKKQKKRKYIYNSQKWKYTWPEKLKKDSFNNKLLTL